MLRRSAPARGEIVAQRDPLLVVVLEREHASLGRSDRAGIFQRVGVFIAGVSPAQSRYAIDLAITSVMRRVAAISARGAIDHPRGRRAFSFCGFSVCQPWRGWYQPRRQPARRPLAVSSPAPRGRSARVTRRRPADADAERRQHCAANGRSSRGACDDAGTSPEAGTAGQRPDWTLSDRSTSKLAVSERVKSLGVTVFRSSPEYRIAELPRRRDVADPGVGAAVTLTAPRSTSVNGPGMGFWEVVQFAADTCRSRHRPRPASRRA